MNLKIHELVRDRQKLDEMKMLQDEVARLQSDMEELRQRLELAEASEVLDIKQKRHQLNKDLSASKWFEKGLATNDIDKQIEYYTYAIEQKPDWSSPYNLRGIAYNDKGDYDSAIADFSRVIQIDPNRTVTYNRLAQVYCTRGHDYIEKGDYDNAIADYSRAIQIDSNYAPAYCYRGLAYDNKGDYDRAITDYNKAIQIKPNYARAYYNRGLAYKHLGDKINAIRSFWKAKELGHPEAQRELDKLR